MYYLRYLLILISHVDTNIVEDFCVWLMENDGMSTIEEIRRITDYKPLSSLVLPNSWDKTLPGEVNIFLWRISYDQFPRHFNLSPHRMNI